MEGAGNRAQLGLKAWQFTRVSRPRGPGRDWGAATVIIAASPLCPLVVLVLLVAGLLLLDCLVAKRWCVGAQCWRLAAAGAAPWPAIPDELLRAGHAKSGGSGAWEPWRFVAWRGQVGRSVEC